MRRDILAPLELCLLCACIALAGCPSTPPSGIRFPIVSGSHSTLPSTEQRILIWADPPLIDMAVDWLRTHHYSQLLMPHKAPLQGHQIAHDFSSRQAALAVAQEMKAEFILLVGREATKEGALIEPHCGALYHVSVEVRGLVVDGGDTSLRASAHYPNCVALNDKSTRNLTCQALATAWGFRPSGQLEIPSSLMCTTGETVPTPVR
jgi:hypothetical protein